MLLKIFEIFKFPQIVLNEGIWFFNIGGECGVKCLSHLSKHTLHRKILPAEKMCHLISNSDVLSHYISCRNIKAISNSVRRQMQKYENHTFTQCNVDRRFLMHFKLELFFPLSANAFWVTKYMPTPLSCRNISISKQSYKKCSLTDSKNENHTFTH